MKATIPTAARMPSTTISPEANQSCASPRSSITCSAPIPSARSATPAQSTLGRTVFSFGSGTCCQQRIAAMIPSGTLM